MRPLFCSQKECATSRSLHALSYLFIFCVTKFEKPWDAFVHAAPASTCKLQLDFWEHEGWARAPFVAMTNARVWLPRERSRSSAYEPQSKLRYYALTSIINSQTLILGILFGKILLLLKFNSLALNQIVEYFIQNWSSSCFLPVLGRCSVDTPSLLRGYNKLLYLWTNFYVYVKPTLQLN